MNKRDIQIAKNLQQRLKKTILNKSKQYISKYSEELSDFSERIKKSRFYTPRFQKNDLVVHQLNCAKVVFRINEVTTGRKPPTYKLKKEFILEKYNKNELITEITKFQEISPFCESFDQESKLYIIYK